MKNLFTISITFLAFASILIAEPLKVELQSERGAQGLFEKNTTSGRYSIEISFIPVTTLDEVTNAEMTEVLSQFYAEEILSQQLGKSIGVIFEKKQKRVKTGNPIIYDYTIPEEAIIEAIKDDMHQAIKALTTGKADAVTKLKDFRSSCFRDMRTAEALYMDMIRDSTNLDELWGKIRRSLNTLQTKIENDNALFLREKKAFYTQLDEISHRLQEEIVRTQKNPAPKTPQSPPDLDLGGKQGISKTNENTDRQSDSKDLFPKEELIIDVQIDAEFKPYLLAEKVMLLAGGCKMLITPDGTKLLVSVGFTEIRGNSAKERVRQLRIAGYNADAEIAKHQRIEVTHFAQRNKSVVVSQENGNEKSKVQRTSVSLTTVQAEASIDSLETIGTWKSADRTLFFVAKGCVINKIGE